MNVFIFGARGRLATCVTRELEEKENGLNLYGFSRATTIDNIPFTNSEKEAVEWINKTNATCIYCMHDSKDIFYELDTIRATAHKIKSTAPVIYVSTAAVYNRDVKRLGSDSRVRLLSRYSLLKAICEDDLSRCLAHGQLHILRPVDIWYEHEESLDSALSRRSVHLVRSRSLAKLIAEIVLNNRNQRSVRGNTVYLASDSTADLGIKPYRYMLRVASSLPRYLINRYILKKKGCLNPVNKYIGSSHVIP